MTWCCFISITFLSILKQQWLLRNYPLLIDLMFEKCIWILTTKLILKVIYKLKIRDMKNISMSLFTIFNLPTFIYFAFLEHIIWYAIFILFLISLEKKQNYVETFSLKVLLHNNTFAFHTNIWHFHSFFTSFLKFFPNSKKSNSIHEIFFVVKLNPSNDLLMIFQISSLNKNFTASTCFWSMYFIELTT